MRFPHPTEYREAMDERFLSVADVARFSQFPPHHIHNLLHGICSIDIEKHNAISKALENFAVLPKPRIIREFILQHGITLAKVAARSRCNYPNVINVLNGKVPKPRRATLVAIIKAINSIAPHISPWRDIKR